MRPAKPPLERLMAKKARHRRYATDPWEPMLPSEPLCRRARWRFALLGLGLLLTTGALHLFLGDPSWSRWHLAAQRRLWPARFQPTPPPGYSGTWRRWDTHGEMVERVHYQRGVLEGPCLRRLGAGRVEEGVYRQGRKDGPWWITDANGGGQLYTYALGVLDGPYRQSAPDGVVRIEGAYRNGARHGSWIERYAHGGLHRLQQYRDGRREGLFRLQDRNGTRRVECAYRDGEANGVYRRWDHQGRLVATLRFVHGTARPPAE